MWMGRPASQAVLPFPGVIFLLVRGQTLLLLSLLPALVTPWITVSEEVGKPVAAVPTPGLALFMKMMVLRSVG